MFDDFPWRLRAIASEEGKPSLSEDADGLVDGSKLRYVGGVDLSFAKEDSSFACGALVVMDLESMQVVYEDFDVVQLTMPYVAGFLAFREVLDMSPSLFSPISNLHRNVLAFFIVLNFGMHFDWLCLVLGLQLQTPVLLGLLKKMAATAPLLYPQVLFISALLSIFVEY